MTPSLPQPSPEQLSRSRQLQQQIVEDIHAQGGWIPFGHYLQQVLYDPQWGYYSNLEGLGVDGDFVTAPEISPLFSRTLARQVAPLLQSLQQAQVVEPGGGSGEMAAIMLLEWEQLGTLPERYSILEVSATLRERQRQRIAAQAPHLLSRVEWLERLPQEPFDGVVVANEVIDAIPFDCFQLREGVVRPLGVSTNPAAELIWSESHQARTIDLSFELPVEGYRSEWRPLIESWIEALSAPLQRGAVVLIDYGYSRSDYYRPERSGGTLSCFYRHRQHDNPFLYPGLQDITAHVDFTAVAEAADRARLRVAGFSTQGYFLLGGGVTELAEQVLMEDESLQQRVELSRAIQQLTLPAQMGEVVKVMALTRGVELPAHFTLYDQLHTL